MANLEVKLNIYNNSSKIVYIECRDPLTMGRWIKKADVVAANSEVTLEAKGNPGVIGMPFTRHYAAGASGIAYTEVKYVPGEPEEFWVAYGIQGLVFKAKHEVVGSGAVLQCTLTIEDA